MKPTIKILAAQNIVNLIPPSSDKYSAEITPLDLHETEIVEKIACIQPDIVFLNMFGCGPDAVSVINSYSALFTESRPCFAVMCSFVSPRLRGELEQCSAYKILTEPFSSQEIHDIIMHVCLKKQQANSWKIGASVSTVHQVHDDMHSFSTEELVSDILLRLGISENIPGSRHLKRAIVLAVENEDMMYSVTRLMYPKIAQEFGTTPSVVERRIRRAIVAAWENNESSVLESYFGHTIDITRGKPANSEFIAMVADRIKLSRRENARMVSAG